MPDPHCPADRHGTLTAYQHYGCRCESARRVARREHERWKLRCLEQGGPLSVDAVGTVRRVRALAAAGWALKDLAAQAGTTRQVVASWGRNEHHRVFLRSAVMVAKLYVDLEFTPGPSAHAAGRARAKGWLGPEFWFEVDIDDPAALPVAPVIGPADPVAVARLCEGSLRAAQVTAGEWQAAALLLRSRGVGTGVIAVRFAMSERTVRAYVKGVSRDA